MVHMGKGPKFISQLQTYTVSVVEFSTVEHVPTLCAGIIFDLFRSSQLRPCKTIFCGAKLVKGVPKMLVNGVPKTLV